MSRLRADFDALCQIGRDPAGGWTRQAFGAADCDAHEFFIDAARRAGLRARHDAFGNAIARLDAGHDQPAVVIGSHLDTVPNGGAYDGALGVLAGLEVARRVAASADRRYALEVIAFRDEEGRFGALPGSRAMTGTLPPDAIAKMRASDGLPLTEALAAAGLDGSRVTEAMRPANSIKAYLELHIEQGSVLERAGIGLGVVTAIAGQQRLSVRFKGRAGHAGTEPMSTRADAFAAAARFADRFRSLVVDTGEDSARGTIGIVKVSPNQGNVIPSDVVLGLEIRDSADHRLIEVRDRTERLAIDVSAELGVAVSARRIHCTAPVAMDAGLQALLTDTAQELGHRTLPILSGANHDAGVLGMIVPAAMLFVPSRGGISHAPDEHTDWPDIEAAVDVLTRAVERLLAPRPFTGT